MSEKISRKTLEPYYEQLRNRCTDNNIQLEHRKKGIKAVWKALNGAGQTITYGESGQKYLAEGCSEKITHIVIYAFWQSVLAHELTHVEQRLNNPTRKDTTLAELEIAASIRALQMTKGIAYPLCTFNELINIMVYLVPYLRARLRKRRINEAE